MDDGTPVNSPVKNIDELLLLSEVSGLTCVSLYSCCSLVNIVVDDLMDRYNKYLEDAAEEYEQEKSKVIAACMSGDAMMALSLIDSKSVKYKDRISLLLSKGSNSSSRALETMSSQYLSPITMGQVAATIENTLNSNNITGNKRKHNSIGVGENTPMHKYQSGHTHTSITQLKMTPTLVKAAELFNRTSSQPNSLKMGRGLLELPRISLDNLSSLPPTRSPMPSPQPPIIHASPNSQLHSPSPSLSPSLSLSPSPSISPLEPPLVLIEIDSTVKDETSGEEEAVCDENKSRSQSGLTSMFKSPLLRLQEKLGIRGFASEKNSPVNVTMPTGMFHRVLKPLGSKDPRDSGVILDEDCLVNNNMVPDWARTQTYRETVRQQQSWNPYSLFGCGVRVIHFEDVFNTPDFRSMAHTAASELRKSTTRERRIQRWYSDKITCGFSGAECMGSEQLDLMIARIGKRNDLSSVAYCSDWIPCSDSCGHDLGRVQPWFKCV